MILEVYQFARDAAVAEAWLLAQEPYLMSTELGHTIDDVENLIKKHEAFEKSAAAQEERFSALERLTTVSFCFLCFVGKNHVHIVLQLYIQKHGKILVLFLTFCISVCLVRIEGTQT